jgi:hypothetical protein
MGQLLEPGRHIRIKCYRGTHEGIMMSDYYAVKMLRSAKVSEFLTYSRIRRFMKVRTLHPDGSGDTVFL